MKPLIGFSDVPSFGVVEQESSVPLKWLLIPIGIGALYVAASLWGGGSKRRSATFSYNGRRRRARRNGPELTLAQAEAWADRTTQELDRLERATAKAYKQLNAADRRCDPRYDAIEARTDALQRELDAVRAENYEARAALDRARGVRRSRPEHDEHGVAHLRSWDLAIQRAADIVEYGGTKQDVIDNLLGKGFTPADAFLIYHAGRLLAADAKKKA